VEVGTGGYLGLLLGAAPFLARCELRGPAALEAGNLDPIQLAAQVRSDSDVAIGLAAVAHESGEDMHVEVGLDIEGRRSRASHAIFRAGEIGRRRSANAAAAELWRRLGD
jgi:hypothetical protein